MNLISRIVHDVLNIAKPNNSRRQIYLLNQAMHHARERSSSAYYNLLEKSAVLYFSIVQIIDELHPSKVACSVFGAHDNSLTSASKYLIVGNK